MFERLVHWLIFLSVVCFVGLVSYDLVAHGSIQEPCCLID